MNKELRTKKEFKYLLIICAVLLAISFFLRDIFKTESNSFELVNVCVAGLLLYCGVYMRGFKEGKKFEEIETKNEKAKSD